MLYDLPAPAKLNLFLHVVGRRADGYHLLQTVFRLISLADRIDVDLRRDGQIVRETDMLGVPHDEDLVVRAARALQAHTGTKLGAQIKVKKNILNDPKYDYFSCSLHLISISVAGLGY